MRRHPAALLALGVLAASCVSPARLAAMRKGVLEDLDQARKTGADKCAPRELALSEAALDFAAHEQDEGRSLRAEDYLKVAEQNARRALDLSRDCAPKPKPAPVVKDSDGDGIPDDIDRCPFDPEDKDGFQDEDGCPDLDNDGDGIVDALDACPNNPGPLSNRGCPVLDRDGDGVMDDVDKCPDEPGPPPDGCPKKYKLVVVKKDRIELKQQVKYATGKWKVLPASYALLGEVAQAMKDYASVRVRVEGNTDNVGGEAFNIKLSQKRAEAVRAYLVKLGVAPERMEAVGYGPARPIASNKTEKGRAQNRRTDFVILPGGG